MSKKENITETPNQDKKVVTRYDRRLQRRKEEEDKRKRDQKITTGICVVIAAAVLVLIISFPVRNYIALHQTFVEIGGEPVTRVEFDYNYGVAANNYYSRNATLLSYMGIDLSGDLSTMMYSTTLTWQDFFQQTAVENIKLNKALLREAKAEGFTYDVSDDYEEFRDNLKSQAAGAGTSIDAYLKSLYGSYATEGRIRKYVENGLFLSAYYKYKQGTMTPAAEEVEAKYEEHPDQYDSVDYRMLQFNATIPTEPTDLADPQPEETEEDSGEEGDSAETETYQPSDAEIEFAMEQAYQEALEAEKTISENGDLYEHATKSNLYYNYTDWLFDDARKEGDTTVVEYELGHCYYVVEFLSRYRDDRPTANARVISTTNVPAETIYNEWLNGEATEERFIELYKKYNEVADYTDNGLYEGLDRDDLEDVMSEWLFAEDRAAGDVTTFELSDEQFVMYYLGESHPVWYYQIQNDFLEDRWTEFQDSITADMTMVDKKGNLAYPAKIAASEEASRASEEAAAQASQEAEQTGEQTGEESADGESESADDAE